MKLWGASLNPGDFRFHIWPARWNPRIVLRNISVWFIFSWLLVPAESLLVTLQIYVWLDNWFRPAVFSRAAPWYIRRDRWLDGAFFIMLVTTWWGLWLVRRRVGLSVRIWSGCHIITRRLHIRWSLWVAFSCLWWGWCSFCAKWRMKREILKSISAIETKHGCWNAEVVLQGRCVQVLKEIWILMFC